MLWSWYVRYTFIHPRKKLHWSNDNYFQSINFLMCRWLKALILIFVVFHVIDCVSLFIDTKKVSSNLRIFREYRFSMWRYLVGTNIPYWQSLFGGLCLLNLTRINQHSQLIFHFCATHIKEEHNVIPLISIFKDEFQSNWVLCNFIMTDL